jgi:hypothetical protein
VTPSDEEYPDLEQSLDEAGEFCRPRGQGWDSLLERLPPRRPPKIPTTQDEPPASPEPTPPPLPRKRRPRRAPRWVWWVAGAIAASLLAAAIVWQAWRPGDKSVDPSHPAEVPVAKDPQLPVMEPVEPVELAAGCQVTPFGNVAYQVVHPNRVQLDAGELFVEIDRERSGNRPFIVETPAGVARAVGTSFVVESRLVETEPRPQPAALNTSNTTSNQPMSPRLPNITFLTKVLVFAGVVQLITAEATVEGRPGEVLETKNPRAIQASHLSLPLYWTLRNPQVQKELNLTQQQLISIGRIGADFVATSREDWAGVMDLEPEDRPQKYQKIRQNTQRRLELVGRKVREVLTPEQFDRLMMAQLRLRGVRVLHAEPAAQRLGIDDEQKRLIRQKTSVMNQRLRVLEQQMQKVRDETFDETMQVLRPEQLRILKEMEASGQRPLGPLQLQSLSAQGRPAAALRQPARAQPQKVSPQAIRAQPHTRPVPTLQKVPPNNRDTRAVAPQNRNSARD